MKEDFDISKDANANFTPEEIEQIRKNREKLKNQYRDRPDHWYRKHIVDTLLAVKGEEGVHTYTEEEEKMQDYQRRIHEYYAQFRNEK